MSALDPFNSCATISAVLNVSRNTARTVYGRPIGSVTLAFLEMVSPAQPRNVRVALVSMAVRVTAVPSATRVSLGTEPVILPPFVVV